MTSTVPAAIDALVALWRGALDGVQVADGEPIEIENDLLVVGFIDVPGEAAVTSTRTREQLAAEPDRESYDITCLASSFSGVTDFKTVRDTAYGLVNTAAAALAGDDTLDGLVMQSRITADDLIQEQTEKGAVATVRFTVHVDAYTS
jgi:hypothetical protein